MFGFFKSKSVPKATTTVVTRKSAPSARSVESKELLKAISALRDEVKELRSLVMSNLPAPEVSDGEEGIAERSLQELQRKPGTVMKNDNERVIEGVFDGQIMIGADGQEYDVPANYASKSKLVEGDILKLTINNLGAFIYKQIKPIERLRQVGLLVQDPQNLQFFAEFEGKRWKLLTASVTYYKGEPGDEVVFFIPAEGGSHWAAVENILKKD